MEAEPGRKTFLMHYCSEPVAVIMAALCNRAGHYIFALWFLSLAYSQRSEVYHTFTHVVAPVRI